MKMLNSGSEQRHYGTARCARDEGGGNAPVSTATWWRDHRSRRPKNIKKKLASARSHKQTEERKESERPRERKKKKERKKKEEEKKKKRKKKKKRGRRKEKVKEKGKGKGKENRRNAICRKKNGIQVGVHPFSNSLQNVFCIFSLNTHFI
ncbi:hypothetical protein ACOSQ2_008090 [Xanthoceras sorbifolium]